MEESTAYIESGILELYVIGQLTALEQAEVEEMASKYPAVREEIYAIEVAMEKYALSHAIQPSDELENRIFTEIATLSNTAPAAAEQKTIPLQPNQHRSTIKTLRYALVACLGLLVMSVAALYSAHKNLQAAKQEILSLNVDKEKFAATVSFMKDENHDLQEIAAIAADPTWKSVKLAGTEIAPEANMIVYWHKQGQHVMVDNSKMTLPLNDKAHQYQLWAMVNGKPVDLGVFDATAGPKKILVSMKETGNAQAFAVTLEKRGGSVNPTMNKLVALGGVSI
ncbi:anti-sigma factor [Pedobacter sp. AW31-3R]|uniref:anti-sigma factor n=1 Tax=Pedobacter sp. AW31-3R TaxID=3445781 RepID=UPI003F9EC80C